MNFNKYIGIPYVPNGRTQEGCDCYGLVRLVQKEQFGIELPSFDTEYNGNDEARLEELIKQYKEGWEQIDKPEAGSVVLFSVLGYESHIGVAVDSESFLHVRENMDSVIEPFSTSRWNKRIVGHFKYSEKAAANLTAIPHPLKTETYTIPVPVGTTVAKLVESINKEYNVEPELKSRIYVAINGVPVKQEDWETKVIGKDDVITYRTLPGKGAVRTLAVLALAVFAPYVAGLAKFAYVGTVGATVGGATAVYGLTYAAVMVGGMALVDKIAPIRPPAEPTDPGSSERQLMVNGGQNQANPYGAIPVVLGKVRMTAQLASKNYLTFENERDSYLSMLLYWGYGPLEITEASYKFGEVPVANFDNKTIITLARKTEPTATQLEQFDAIYGKDVAQVVTNQELVCDGNPEVAVTPGPWFGASTTQAVDTVSVSLHFPQGLRKVKAQGSDAGSSYGTPVNLRIERSSDGTNWTLVEAFNAAPLTTRQVTTGQWVDTRNPGENEANMVYQETVSTVVEPLAKKDAFTITKTYSRFTSNLGSNAFKYIRVRRETGDNVEDNPDWRYYHQVVLHNVAFTTNTKPAIDPPNCKIAKTVIKIKASDQLNGSVEGFNAIVQTIAPIWNGTDWNTQAPTSNPASLMIYVLTHPANPRRKTLNNIDLTNLANFYNYCQTKGFEYNAVLGSQRSLLDVLRDICAAGRGSPALKDGKWSVTIDEPKAQIVQMFTPHNSWGFEGVKNLPDIPHGLRVRYYDQDQSYQEAEIIVYNTGYSEANASLFESITLPGVTKKSSVIDHARWHMAQAKLRPEVYSFNADIEYIVANRGDRVKVMHDVPMWGLGSGRVRNRISSTVLELDEPVPMEAGKNYMLRIRSKTGAMITRNLVAVTADGYYDEVTLTASTTQAEADALDLFMFGENQQEGQDLLIISVEPTSSKSARITCVDYGVTDTYNIFTGYLTLTENVVFESQITLPGKIQFNAFGDKKPTITLMRSDETVMQRSTTGSLQSVINVSYLNAFNLPPNTVQVHAEYDISAATDNTNVRTVVVDYIKGSIVLPDVVDGEEYKVRLRYVSNDGRVGLWTAYTNHVVVGKTTPPPPFDYVDVETAEDGTRKYYFGYFEGNKPIDWKGAEIRYTANLSETNFNKMIPLQTNQTFYTASPVETASPQEGLWRFAFRSIDTSDFTSTAVFLNVSLDRSRTEAVLSFYDEQQEGWTGTKTALEYQSSDQLPSYLLGIDGSYTWDSLVTWDSWPSLKWAGGGSSSASYVSPVRDFGRQVTGEFKYRVASDGDTVVEIRYSNDNITWTAWGLTSNLITCRYLQVRVLLTRAIGATTILALYSLSYSLYLRLSKEDVLNLDISTLTGANRIGIGDVRVPLVSTYSYIQKIVTNIIDPSAGSWTVQVIDKSLTGWRFQFKLNGVLTDPDFVDFYIEGSKL